MARPGDREHTPDAARQWLSAPRSHRRAGRSAMDHGRGPERHRPGRPEDHEGTPLYTSREHRVRKPEHRDVRPPWRPVVHWPERDVRPTRPKGWEGACLSGAPWRRAIRDYDDSLGHCLLRLPRGELSGADRHPNRQGDGPFTADEGTRCETRVVGLPWTHLDQRVERRKARDVRPRPTPLA